MPAPPGVTAGRGPSAVASDRFPRVWRSQSETQVTRYLWTPAGKLGFCCKWARPEIQHLGLGRRTSEQPQRELCLQRVCKSTGGCKSPAAIPPHLRGLTTQCLLSTGPALHGSGHYQPQTEVARAEASYIPSSVWLDVLVRC